MNRPRLLDEVQNILCVKHYSIRTEEAYVQLIKRFIIFHNNKHPADMGEAEVSAFFTHLVVKNNVTSSTQNQALSAFLFLYKHVLEIESWSENIFR